MTVEELIQKLITFEQNKTVYVQCIYQSDKEESVEPESVREYDDMVIVGS